MDTSKPDHKFPGPEWSDRLLMLWIKLFVQIISDPEYKELRYIWWRIFVTGILRSTLYENRSQKVGFHELSS